MSSIPKTLTEVKKCTHLINGDEVGSGAPLSSIPSGTAAGIGVATGSDRKPQRIATVIQQQQKAVLAGHPSSTSPSILRPTDSHHADVRRAELAKVIGQIPTPTSTSVAVPGSQGNPNFTLIAYQPIQPGVFDSHLISTLQLTAAVRH